MAGAYCLAMDNASWSWSDIDCSWEFCASPELVGPGDLVLAEGLDVEWRESSDHGWLDGIVYDVARDSTLDWRIRWALITDVHGDTRWVSLSDVRPTDWRERNEAAEDALEREGEAKQCCAHQCERCV